MFNCLVRRRAPVVVWSLCLATFLVTPTAFADQLYPSAVSRSEREKQIIGKLKHDVEGFDFAETQLQLVLEAIEDIHGLQIVIDTPALKASGLDSTVPVTSLMSGISLRSALSQTLAPLGLTYVVRDEVLMITTPDSPNAFEVRCYNVRQLLSHGQSTNELTGSLSRILDTPTLASFGGYGGGENAFGDEPGPTGVTGRCIAPFGNVIIVRDTMSGHEQIGRVLATLRDVLREGENVAHANARMDRPAPRPTIRRAVPEVRRHRRSGETAKSNQVDDPFSDPVNRKPTLDPFEDVDKGGSSNSNDPFGDLNESSGAGADDPFGGLNDSKGPEADDPFGD